MVAIQGMVQEQQPLPQRELGRFLARARLRAHLTQDELATRASVSQGFIAHLEQGHRGVAPDTLRALTDALGVEYNDAALLAGYIRDPALARPIVPEDEDDRRLLSLPRRVKKRLLRTLDVWTEFPLNEEEGGEDGPDGAPDESGE